jgi:hypothetical protein
LIGADGKKWARGACASWISAIITWEVLSARNDCQGRGEPFVFNV